MSCALNGTGTPNATIGTGNAMPNINQQQIIMSDINDQYEQDCMLDASVNTFLINGDTEKYSYSPGFGGWDSEQIELSDDFKQHYELWLQREVYGMTINWDSLRSKSLFEETMTCAK